MITDWCCHRIWLPIQVVIVPIYKNDEMLKKIDAKVEGIVSQVESNGYLCEI